MSRYIGPAPGQKNFFYGFSRSNDGELTFTKVDFLAGYGQTVVINDLELREDQEAQYDFPVFDQEYFHDFHKILVFLLVFSAQNMSFALAHWIF